MSLDEELDTNLWLDEPLYELCRALVGRRRQAVQSVHYGQLARRLGSRGSSVRVRVGPCILCMLCVLVRHTVSTMVT